MRAAVARVEALDLASCEVPPRSSHYVDEMDVLFGDALPGSGVGDAERSDPIRSHPRRGESDRRVLSGRTQPDAACVEGSDDGLPEDSTGGPNRFGTVNLGSSLGPAGEATGHPSATHHPTSMAVFRVTDRDALASRRRKKGKGG